MFTKRLIRVPLFEVICLVCLLFEVTTIDALCSNNTTESVEARLLKCLKSIRTGITPPPTYKNGLPVATTISITAAQFTVLEMDDRENMINGNVFLRLKWVDSRLTWDPSNYNNLHQLFIPAFMIWTPEPSFMFSGVSSGGKAIENWGLNTFIAEVHNDGTVIWPIHIGYTGSCMVDFTTYPLDKQNCQIHIFFNPDDPEQLNYEVYDNNSYHSFSPEWKIISSEIFVRLVGFTSREHYGILISLKLIRRSAIYMYMLVAPLVLIGILCLQMFWVPIMNNQRFVYATTLFISILLIFISFQTNMPTGVRKIPIFVKCLLYEITFLSIFIIISIFTNLAYYHDPRNKLPPFVKTIFLNPIIKKLTLVGNSNNRQHSTDVENCLNKPPTATATNADHTLRSLCQYFSTLRQHKFRNLVVQISENEWMQLAIVVERLAFYCAVLAFCIVAILVPIEVANHEFNLTDD